MKPIQTQRLLIREITKTDAAFILDLMNEPAYHKNIGDRGLRSISDAENYIQDKFVTAYEKQGYGLYLVVVLESLQPAGMCGLVKREILDAVDVGFAIHSKFQRQGYALESALALMNHARLNLGMKQFYGLTDPGNQASARLLEKLGMKFQGLSDTVVEGKSTRIFKVID